MSTARSPGAPSLTTGAGPALLVCVAIGVITFVVGLILGSYWGLAVWQAFHINFVYFTGLTFSGVVISAIFVMTSSGWGSNIRRLAEAAVALVPLVLVAYLGIIASHHLVAPAAHYFDDPEHLHEHLIGGKAVWLEPAFLLTRDGLALLLLSVLSLVFVYFSVRPAMGRALAQGKGRDSGLARWIARDFKDHDREAARSTRITATLAPILTITYALVISLIGFDQVMSLDIVWISTLFGAYIFITSLYMTWAGLGAAAVLLRQRKKKDALAAYGERITTDDLHDLGKLTFAFCMLGADFFWSQFVVIWYGNIPEETPFIRRRVYMEPWSDVAWAVAFLCYVIPFVLLLFKRIKRTDTTMAAITIAIMVMMWLERFLLIAPSVWREELVGEQVEVLLPQLAVGLGVTLGFVGLAGLLYRWALSTLVLAPAISPAREDHYAKSGAEAEAAEKVLRPSEDVDGDEGKDESDQGEEDEEEEGEDEDEEEGEDEEEDEDEEEEDEDDGDEDEDSGEPDAPETEKKKRSETRSREVTEGDDE